MISPLKRRHRADQPECPHASGNGPDPGTVTRSGTATGSGPHAPLLMILSKRTADWRP